MNPFFNAVYCFTFFFTVLCMCTGNNCGNSHYVMGKDGWMQVWMDTCIHPSFPIFCLESHKGIFICDHPYVHLPDENLVVRGFFNLTKDIFHISNSNEISHWLTESVKQSDILHLKGQRSILDRDRWKLHLDFLVEVHNHHVVMILLMLPAEFCHFYLTELQ